MNINLNKSYSIKSIFMGSTSDIYIATTEDDNKIYIK